MSEIAIPTTNPNALGYDLNEAMNAAKILEVSPYDKLKDNWRVKYGAKSIICKRKNFIDETIRAYVPLGMVEFFDVVNVIVTHDYNTIGTHFVELTNIDEFKEFLEDYHYEFEPSDGLKIWGKK